MAQSRDGAPPIVHLLGYLRAGGGPSGYLYNLHQACSTLATPPIGFAANAIEHSRHRHDEPRRPSRLTRFLARMAPDRALAAWAAARARADTNRTLSPALAAQLVSADAVVVHDWLLFHHYLNWRDRSGRAGQLAILMDHSPRSPNELAAEDWAARWDLPDKVQRISEQLEPFVLDAFSRADAILVPNRHALDAFYPDQERKRRVLLSKPIVELPSGLPALQPVRNRDEVRRELALAVDDILIGYLGRYEHEKGYDVFVEAARRAAANPRFAHLRFVAAGHGPMKADHSPPNLAQLGWRRDAPDLLNAFDILLAPNRFAYFDLVILEAMSLGKTVYTTFVGGSKGLAPGSVRHLREGPADAVVTEILSLAGGDRPLLDPEDVLRIFAENYSQQVFLRRHLDLASDISRQFEA